MEIPINEKGQIDWNKLKDLDDENANRVIKDIIQKMTLVQKAWQMAGDESLLPGVLKSIKRYNAHPIIAGKDDKLGIPGIRFSDGPRGIVMNSSTCFPVSIARGATWNPALEERVGNAIGIEARAQGANFFGGVCINLLRHPAWGRAQETYGEDPFHVGEMGVALVKGVQNHVMACAKHFACNSIENARFKVSVEIDERTLREVYLPHFKKCVDAGVASIMNAYNKVNGIYCGHNKHLLRDILKNDWNFDGFVITDFILGIRDGKKAILAGVDIEMPFKFRMKPKKIERWVKKNKIDEELINEAVFRILKQKLRFNKSRQESLSLYHASKVACEDHVNLALEVARESIVLLKNEGSLLPLKDLSGKKILILGKLASSENIGDHGSSRVYPPKVITFLDGFKKLVSGIENVNVRYYNGKNLKRVARLAMDADFTIIVAGYTHSDEGEYLGYLGGDRKSLRLKENECKLISVASTQCKNTIVIMIGGSAIITTGWQDKVPAILMGWYPGMMGGIALSEILLGKVNSSGKLPVSFPKFEDQLPFFDRNARSIKYDYFHGYWLLDKNGFEPAFPFGHGLSYTSFKIKRVDVLKEEIQPGSIIPFKVTIANTGDMDGAEIIQVYASGGDYPVELPAKRLKAFKKIQIPKNKEVETIINVNSNDLAFFDVESRDWKLKHGTNQFFISTSSRDKSPFTKNVRIQ
ncbi:MAG: beta-glucosidase family protein [Promethearchaeota archaeon]